MLTHVSMDLALLAPKCCFLSLGVFLVVVSWESCVEGEGSVDSAVYHCSLPRLLNRFTVFVFPIWFLVCSSAPEIQFG